MMSRRALTGSSRARAAANVQLRKTQSDAPNTSRSISTALHKRPASLASKPLSSSTNPQISFPCIDLNEQRTERIINQTYKQRNELGDGPEPSYSNVITGYKVFHHDKPYICDYGGILPELDIAYETWGILNSDKSNAILIGTGLSGSSHAKSHPENTTPGWWEKFIGPNKPIDTNKFFVICTNVIGGCYGSTGPSSIDPSNGEPYATRFPIITIFDMIRAQFLLFDHLGIKKLHAAVGSSMGGMQSIAAAHLFPDRVGRVISISAAARSHPYSIAIRHTQRQVLMADPNFNRGFYYNGIPPHTGMKLAREIATITYRSGPEWEQRFGRKRANEDQNPSLCPDFLIETYLDYQGERWCLQYDANSLLYISKAMDMFDMSGPALRDLQEIRAANLENTSTRPAKKQSSALEQIPKGSNANLVGLAHSPSGSTSILDKDLSEGLKNLANHPTLILGVQSDILFPYWQQKELAHALRRAGNEKVTYYELDAIYGHDTFLIDLVGVGGAVNAHLEMDMD